METQTERLVQQATANRLLPFVFENGVAHGAIVRITEGVSELLGHRDMSASMQALIREALVAMPLFATHLNFQGRINLQFQGEGRAKLLVAQIDEQLNVRAMAKAPADLEGSFAELLYGGVLALMVEPNDERRAATQAVVLIEGDSLAEALEGYFARSEQLPTMIRLTRDGDRLSAFMLQRMPLESSKKATEADWEHVLTLASTLGEQELSATEPLTILRRLFANDELRVFEPRPVTVACRCSHAGISRMLLSLGRSEVESIIAEQGQVQITCEFCGREYRFDPPEVGQLFDAAEASPDGTTH